MITTPHPLRTTLVIGGSIVTFGQDEAGELYLADFSAEVLYRFVADD